MNFVRMGSGNGLLADLNNLDLGLYQPNHLPNAKGKILIKRRKSV